MKSSVLSVVALAALFLVACGPNEAEITAAKEKTAADSIAALSDVQRSYILDGAASKVTWTGTMLGVKSHTGTVNLNEGMITTKGSTLTGGDFAVDMKSIAPLDTNYAPAGSKQGTKENLVGHLSSPDFFAVDSFPVAKFSISAVEGNTATGVLTLRGKGNEEKVTDIILTPNADGTITVTGKLAFDRQKYGAAWKSPMKDVVLNDAIELTVELTGKAQ